MFPNVLAPGGSGAVPNPCLGEWVDTVRSTIISLVSLVLFLGFSWWAVKTSAPQVEADVRNRVERTLMAEEMGYADAVILGRDVYLTGSLANDVYYRSASAVVRDVPGVRWIGRTETPGVPSLLHVTASPNTVILRGDVAESEVRAAVVVATGDVLGRRTLIDSLKVNLGRHTPLWTEDFPRVLTAVSERLDEFDLYLTGTRLYVEGRVESELIRTELGEILGELLPGFVIINALRVPVGRDEFERRLEAYRASHPLEFTADSDELTRDLRADLDQLVPLLRSFPNARLLIQSHVNPTGDAAVDLTLTYNRSNKVREYLVSRGVPPTTLEAEGLGGSRPLPTNVEGRASANDRIELHVIEES